MSRYDSFILQEQERLKRAETNPDQPMEIAPDVTRIGPGSVGGKGLGIGYFSVSLRDNEGFPDTAWLSETPAEEGEYLRHISFLAPLRIAVDGSRHFGVIFKP